MLKSIKKKVNLANVIKRKKFLYTEGIYVGSGACSMSICSINVKTAI